MAEPSTSGLTSGSVSVVIPCYNEEKFIGAVLQNLAPQYDQNQYEVIIVDGNSTDNTKQVIEEFAQSNRRLRLFVVDNPQRHIPVALNLGIRAAKGEFIVRMDAHSVPSPDYVSRCVQLLKQKEAEVVGMCWRLRAGANSATARAIALAVSHPFGVGDALYRLKTASARLVDTVPFGAFRKSLWEQLGGFNEKLLANEDYDFNYRVRTAGGKVLLDSEAFCEYFARPTLSQLARQYWRYGSWKAQMLKLHPTSVRLRQVVAPLFVVWICLTLLTGFLWNTPLWLLVATVSVYLLVALSCSATLSIKNGNIRTFIILPLVFMTIHFSWGSGFLLGLAKRPG
jgi:glycosyltransferase involved in cell wall biosynthesis